ncbi:Ppx/GppA phosphatase family protein [Phormidium tenue]|uniref:Exopolyphosphatase n=1 Tax=Phormidium tenue NIES-30 TaxID=549789 RepID=A0A1U7J4F6_9CYAN|nr:Ppx/GppA phosphatase family protein [Phormidium tenue]MBD2232911.1 Ppx/GppA family phosphatase [Phormidium tenue FACHB-1052]OKH47410.1 exopolyphosphatase [Phormidium tenue NIES-30]
MTGTTTTREIASITDFSDFAPPEITSDRVLAAIDVGTNSIHMVVVKIQPDLPAFSIIDREKETVRLGDFNAATGGLSEAAMERAIKALKRCCAIATSLQAEDIVAVATSAVREASNGQEFVERVYTEVGLALNLISGTEEARRIYLGVLSGVEFNGQPHAIIDIGGGSTELILGTGEPHRFLSSTKVGAVRLTAQFISTDPISDAEFSSLRAYVRGMVEPNTTKLKHHLQDGEPMQLMGTSGTIECLAAVIAAERLGLVPNPLNGFQMSYDEISRLVETLRQATYAERLALPEMSPRRAEIVVAGAVILHETMGLLNADSITICERALREGVVVDWMLTHGLIEDRMQFQKSVRQRNILKTAKKYKVHLDRSKRVAEFAMDLFEQTRGSLHTWGNLEKELLWAAAILHNCGHFVSHSSHHKHSYYLIRHGELLGYTETELEVIANIARYHRKSAPKKKHENYRSLPTRYHRQMITHLSALLRLAVALDRRGIGAVESIHCNFDADAHLLTIEVKAANPNDDCASELWNLDYKKTYFEQVFEVNLTAHLVS